MPTKVSMHPNFLNGAWATMDRIHARLALELGVAIKQIGNFTAVMRKFSGAQKPEVLAALDRIDATLGTIDVSQFSLSPSTSELDAYIAIMGNLSKQLEVIVRLKSSSIDNNSCNQR